MRIYQAWKHLNGAIDALRARSAARSQAAEPLVRPAPADKATRGSPTFRTTSPPFCAATRPMHAQHGAQRAEEAAGRSRLPAIAVRTSPASWTGSSGWRWAPRSRGKARSPPRRRGKPVAARVGLGQQERQTHPVPADPPEATVTFVVRETRAPLLPSAELPSDLGTERNSALFDRLRSLDEAPEPPATTYSPSDAADEEAEVTIVSVEDLRQRREAEERAGIVRRFRKALSGD